MKEWIGNEVNCLQNTKTWNSGIPLEFRMSEAVKVRNFHEKMPGYEKTDLVSLSNLAAKLHVKGIYVKDESDRFSLKAFKGLGGSYAMFRILCEKMELDPENTSPRELIEKIREHQGDVAKAVKECIQQDVLADYLTFYGSEVINMLYTEYDSELAMQIKSQEEYEKGKAEGRAEGEAKGRAEGEAKGRAEGEAKGEAKGKAEFIKQMLKNGFTAEKIISLFNLSKEETNLYFGDVQTI